MPSDAELISQWEGANSSSLATGNTPAISNGGSPSDDEILANWHTAQSSQPLPWIARAANNIQAAEDTLGSQDGLMGLLKGAAKGGYDVLMAPADLAVHGVNSALNYVTGNEIDPKGLYPSDLFGEAVDRLAGGQGNKTTEAVAHAVTNLGTIVAAPSQAKNITQVVSKLPFINEAVQGEGALSSLSKLLTKTLGYSTEGAGWGALADPKSDHIVQNMETGAAINTAIPAVFGTIGAAVKKIAPSEEGALLNAFRVPDAKATQVEGALKSLKDQGVITSPASKQPFADIKEALKVAKTDTSTAIGENLKGKSLTVADVWPSSQSLTKTLSGADRTAAVKALKTEQDNLVKLALAKKFAPPAGTEPLQYAERLMDRYKSLQAAAKAGDKAAKQTVQTLDGIIDGTDISGNELWQLRQGYDAQSKWNRIDPQGKAEAYRGFRDTLQQQLLQLGGKDTAPLFSDLKSQMQGEKYIERLAGREGKGLTQTPSALPRMIQSVLHPISTALRTFVGGIERSQPAEVFLERAFGQSPVQRLNGALETAGQAVPNIAKTIGGTADEAISVLNGGPLGKGEAPLPIGTQKSPQAQEVSRQQSLSSLNSAASKTAKQEPTVLSRLLDAVVPNADASEMMSPRGKKMDKKSSEVLEQIKKNPIDHAIMLMESGGDPKAKNPTSSASGFFQLLSKTAKNLGVTDVFDAEQNYAGFKKLKAETIRQFGSDDLETIYASHYLGAPTLKKLMEGKDLTAAQMAQVEELKTKLLPRLRKIYQGLTEAEV